MAEEEHTEPEPNLHVYRNMISGDRVHEQVGETENGFTVTFPMAHAKEHGIVRIVDAVSVIRFMREDGSYGAFLGTLGLDSGLSFEGADELLFMGHTISRKMMDRES